jgi:hypothetical protein
MCSYKPHGFAELCLGILTGALFSLSLTARPAGAVPVLFVADLDDPQDERGNNSVVNRLVTLGHDVETIDDNEAMTVDPAGKELIVISSSTASANVGSHFTDEPIPIVQWESALWDELLMSASGPNIDGQTSIDVVDTTHRLAQLMGLTDVGVVEIRDFPTTFHGGDRNQATLAPDATLIAQEVRGTSPLIAVIDEGGELTSGDQAPAIRIMLFHGDEALDGVNDVGLRIFDGAINYALGNVGGLFAGDADMDLDFDQLDLVRVQIAAKYLTGRPATWGEGDWDGAPGGQPGSPPRGNGRFDQLDIVAALGPGHYLMGPYAAVRPRGMPGDNQTSIVYNAATGQVAVDAPLGVELTSINIDSGSGVFIGDPAQNLGGSFDNDSDANIFKATFGSSFGSLSFGNVARPGLSQDFVLGDLTVVGSLAGGGALGDVDLIYVPEPSTAALVAMGMLALLAWAWEKHAA